MTGTPKPGELIDARGLKCPMPVLKAEKRLDALAARNAPVLLDILADDPVARIDIPVMCNKRGLECAAREDGAAWRFTISSRLEA